MVGTENVAGRPTYIRLVPREMRRFELPVKYLRRARLEDSVMLRLGFWSSRLLRAVVGLLTSDVSPSS